MARKKKLLLFLAIVLLSFTVSFFVFSRKRDFPVRIFNSDSTKSLLSQRTDGETMRTMMTLSAASNCNSRTATEECFYQTARVINPHEFRLKANNAALCGSSNVRLLILILSRVNDFDKRLAQRETWGSLGRDPSQPVRIAFLLGNTSDEELQSRVTAEFLQYNDILQETFTDTDNRTLKTVMLFRWASTFCPKAKWIVKTNSDVFVNVPRLLQFLKGQDSSDKPQPKTLFGRMASHRAPVRFNHSLWYASEASYPMDLYPPYAFGPCYAMTADLPGLLYKMSEKTPFFHLDDVFVGILMKKLEGNYVNNEGFRNSAIPYSACSYRDVFCAAGVSPAGMRMIWAEMKDRNLNCGR